MGSQMTKKNSMFQFLDKEAPGTPILKDLPLGPPKELAKSRDSEYSKLGVYLRKETHRAARLKAMSQDLELSDLVEMLLQEWLVKQQS